MQIDWSHFKVKFQNWNRVNTYKPNSVEKAFQVMRNAAFSEAPHAFQPAFVKLFGPIEPRFLTKNIKHECNAIRTKYATAVRSSKVPRLDKRVASKAIHLTNEQFGLTGLRFSPHTAQEASERLPGETSSGAPDYTRPKRELLPKVLKYIKCISNGTLILPRVKDFWPITIVWRTQMRATGEKHRIIAAFPQVITVLEMMFAKPFFEYFDSMVGELDYSYGSKYFNNAEVWKKMQAYDYYVEIDYTAFDQSISNMLIFLFYENLKEFLKLDELDNFLFNYVRDYHLYACIINSTNGKPEVIENKTASVLSGSVFTSFADSWINRFILNYCAISLGYDTEQQLVRVMGDDTIIGTNDDPDILLEAYRTQIKTVFGMTVGPSSQIRNNGEPFYYMGFLMTDQYKYMVEDLIMRKCTFTGRFIPEDILPNKMVVWSKYCSICSSCSNGYSFWVKHKNKLLNILNMHEPSYFHDLTEGPNKPFSVERIIENANDYVRTAWYST